MSGRRVHYVTLTSFVEGYYRIPFTQDHVGYKIFQEFFLIPILSISNLEEIRTKFYEAIVDHFPRDRDYLSLSLRYRKSITTMSSASHRF